MVPPSAPRLLITAGPTHEPIDAVRYLGNRSSGTLGLALIDAGVRAGFEVTALLGPGVANPQSEAPQSEAPEPEARIERFRSAEDLRTLLVEHAPASDVLIMAAAVADYRPRLSPGDLQSKKRRTDAGLTLKLEPVPDLLAEIATTRRPGQFFAGFALEPREELLESAERKLLRKNVDAIVANPLETMDAGDIEARILTRETEGVRVVALTDGPVSKAEFATRFIAWIGEHRDTADSES